MVDDLLLDLDSVQADIWFYGLHFPRLVTAIEKTEASLWLAFSRSCYALESGL